MFGGYIPSQLEEESAIFDAEEAANLARTAADVRETTVAIRSSSDKRDDEAFAKICRGMGSKEEIRWWQDVSSAVSRQFLSLSQVELTVFYSLARDALSEVERASARRVRP